MRDTTTMMVEHLINGFHFLVTLILVVFMFMGLLGHNVMDVIQRIAYSNFQFEFFFVNLFLFTPFIYTLGILIDNFVDNLFFKKGERRIRNSMLKNNESGRELIMRTKDNNQAKQLDYIRTRIRISRTATFCYTAITFLLVMVTFQHARAYFPLGQVFGMMVIEFLFGGFLIFLAYYSWKTSTVTFCKRIKNGFEMLQKQQRHAN